jgi:hypothetical protein
MPQKSRRDTLPQTYVFASAGIWGSRSAFGAFYGSRSAFRWVWGMKRRRTIFHARVGPVGIAQKVRQNLLCRTIVFASNGNSGSHSAF